MKQLNPQDAQFLFMEDGHLASHVTSLIICDQSTAPGGTVRFKQILNCVEDRLRNSPVYRQKLMRLPFDFDFPYWVDDPHFDLEYHVRHGRLPAPQDWRQLCIHVARYHSRPLDMTRPLWEIYVIEGLNKIEGLPKNAFALVTKIHHAAVDGTSAQEFLFSMMDFSPTGPAIVPPHSGPKASRSTAASPLGIVARAAVNNAAAPWRLANEVLKIAPKAAASALNVARGKSQGGRSVPQTRFNGDISPNRAFDGVTFPLEDFKTVRKAFDGAKINDVVLAVCAGGLRSYLQSKNELPTEPLVITAPINARTDKAASPKSDGNNISAMAVPLFTNIADPTDRLRAIVRASREAKAAKGGLSARAVTDIAKHIPAPTQSIIGPLLLNNAFVGERMCNAFISNVAGVQFPVYFCGAKVLETHGMAPIGAGVGLFIATPSYDGKIAFSITTTRQIMPDTPHFIECLRVALNELKLAAAKRGDHQPVTAADRVRKRYHRVRPHPVAPSPDKRPSSARDAAKSRSANGADSAEPASTGTKATAATTPGAKPTRKPSVGRTKKAATAAKKKPSETAPSTRPE